MKYYVVSDVHGFYSLLRKALREKGYFDDRTPHKLIICGDLFDRGAEAKALQAFVLDLMEKDEVILVRGNHEDLAVELLDCSWKYLKSKAIALDSHHNHNGTLDTFFQLTDSNLSEAINCPPAFSLYGKRTPYVSRMIPQMLDYYETKRFVFVHGWIPCTKQGRGYVPVANWRKATAQEWERARWLNGMDCHHHGIEVAGKTVVCGHFHTSYGHYYFGDARSEWEKGAIFTPYEREGILALDGCTSHSKLVNCVVVEDEES